MLSCFIALLSIVAIPATAVAIGTAPVWCGYLEKVIHIAETKGPGEALAIAFRPLGNVLMESYLRLEPLSWRANAAAVLSIPALFGLAIYINTLP